MTEEESQQQQALEDIQEQQAYLQGMPPPQRKDTIFRFFRDLLDRKDSSKVANLMNEELGKPKITVRGFQTVALYADAEDLDIVAKYLRAEGEITLATSLSRKGFLPQLFVTQIKKEQKVKPAVDKTKWFKSKVEE